MKELDNVTKATLKMAYSYCNNTDKSTEFMLEYLQSVADVDLDTVIEYLKTTH